MTKRADGKFRRNERDKYYTPDSAIEPLLKHLPPRCDFIEPCAGDGRMVKYLVANGHSCQSAYDIEPGHISIIRRDALKVTKVAADYFITNPPWDRPILHKLIDHLSSLLPTWLLFDADWMHTGQAKELAPWCRKVVSVGRVKWIEGSKSVGFDNCAWYLFDRTKSGPTEFVWRT